MMTMMIFKLTRNTSTLHINNFKQRYMHTFSTPCEQGQGERKGRKAEKDEERQK